MSDTPEPSPESKLSIEPTAETIPWYKEGLRFGCTGCGNCCTIEGHVWVDRREARRLARHLGIDLDAFGKKYLRKVGWRYSLTEVPIPGVRGKRACVFWNGVCTVYPARPRQCRTFPFWKENLESPETWLEAEGLSPGVGAGRLYSIGEIEDLAAGKGETGGG